jgi:hypothetical protein
MSQVIATARFGELDAPVTVIVPHQSGNAQPHDEAGPCFVTVPLEFVEPMHLDPHDFLVYRIGFRSQICKQVVYVVVDYPHDLNGRSCRVP